MGDVRSKQSVQPHVTTSVQTPFCFRLLGPAEVYADAVVTQQNMAQVHREGVTLLRCCRSLSCFPCKQTIAVNLFLFGRCLFIFFVTRTHFFSCYIFFVCIFLFICAFLFLQLVNILSIILSVVRTFLCITSEVVKSS